MNKRICPNCGTVNPEVVEHISRLKRKRIVIYMCCKHKVEFLIRGD